MIKFTELKNLDKNFIINNTRNIGDIFYTDYYKVTAISIKNQDIRLSQYGIQYNYKVELK